MHHKKGMSNCSFFYIGDVGCSSRVRFGFVCCPLYGDPFLDKDSSLSQDQERSSNIYQEVDWFDPYLWCDPGLLGAHLNGSPTPVVLSSLCLEDYT